MLNCVRSSRRHACVLRRCTGIAVRRRRRRGLCAVVECRASLRGYRDRVQLSDLLGESVTGDDERCETCVVVLILNFTVVVRRV
jgi:hypothetical protein